MKTMGHVLGAALAVMIAVPATAFSQERVGIATTVLGPVTIARASAPAEPLKFKDDIHLNDRVTTGERGFTRLLLGGKAVVTAREHSVLTITEVPGTSTVSLVSGRISVVVDKAKMRPGELVEIKTPNAVAGIRGTIVVAETAGNASRITVLRGLVDVYRLDPTSGQAVGPATPVGAREAVTVRGAVLPTTPQRISGDQAGRLSQEFTPPVHRVSSIATLPPSEETGRARSAVSALSGPPATPSQDGRRDVRGERSNGNGIGGDALPRLASGSSTLTSTTTTLSPTQTIGGGGTNDRGLITPLTNNLNREIKR
ncbi:MAG TPA: FecR family protein [Methylomirabilota bacterium]|jgi:hypothetical protein|nr:FecR family protein [Methylomirabilota bacterium]